MSVSRFSLVVIVAWCLISSVSVQGRPHASRHHHQGDETTPVESYAEVNSSNIDSMFHDLNHASLNHSSLGSGTYGLDISQPYSSSTFRCLRQKGFSFATIRAWRSTCSPDTNARGSIQAAWAGGMNKVDVYFFPAYRCGKTAAQQVNAMIDSLSGLTFGTVWFDIESSGSQWSSVPSNNVRWLQAAVNQAQARLGAGRVGIYTSKSSWVPIFGNSAAFGQFPVWYAHYDGLPSFGDWQSFGGWRVPAIKQFNDGPSVCGASIDHNWY